MENSITVKSSIELKNLIDSKIKKVANELEINNICNGKIKCCEYKTDDAVEKLIFNTFINWHSFFKKRENERKLNRLFKHMYKYDCKQLIRMYYERHIGYDLNCSAPSFASIVVGCFTKYICDINMTFKLSIIINKMVNDYNNDKDIVVVNSSDVLTVDMYYQIIEGTILKVLLDKLFDYIIFKKDKFVGLVYENIRNQIMINAASLMATNQKFIRITNELSKDLNTSEQEKLEKLRISLIEMFGYNSPYTININNALNYNSAKIAIAQTMENYSSKIFESYKFARESLIRDCTQLAFVTYFDLSKYFAVCRITGGIC